LQQDPEVSIFRLQLIMVSFPKNVPSQDELNKYTDGNSIYPVGKYPQGLYDMGLVVQNGPMTGMRRLLLHSPVKILRDQKGTEKVRGMLAATDSTH
jgi:hypothetical protein